MPHGYAKHRAGTCLVAASLVLAGCETGIPSADELRLTSDGAGGFEGLAGINWTEERIRTAVAADTCGGQEPISFASGLTEEGFQFSGVCPSVDG